MIMYAAQVCSQKANAKSELNCGHAGNVFVLSMEDPSGKP